MRYSEFGSDIASVNIEYRRNLKYHTAATDGKSIFLDPDYFASLSEDDRIFIIAHEIMHIKFLHPYRLEEKNGKKRDLDTFNEAADAVINANLERDGFIIKEGYVNRPEALKFSVEEYYEKLLREKQKQDNRESKSGKQQSGTTVANKEHYGDDHSLWEEAFEKYKKEKGSQGIGKKSSDKNNKQSTSSNSDMVIEINERAEFSKNRQGRQAKARENLKKMREKLLKKFDNIDVSNRINLGVVGEGNHSIDWRTLLRREIEKSEIVWSQRRSVAENNYAYRLEENEIEDEAETEVMIDVSGSVDLELVKAFLRMLKPILQHSKLKVGCFNEKFWGMTEIKNNNDIDNFIIPAGARGRAAWTEDWDLAVRSFTKKKEINKIVFTDGDPCPGVMPKDDLRGENIIWLVYGNRDFRPCCGKVIMIADEQIKKLSFIDGDSHGRKR